MSVVRVSAILLLLCCTFASANDCSFGEAVVCRNFYTAQKCGMLGACKRLWNIADFTSTSKQSQDCRQCEHFLASKNFDTLSDIVNQKGKPIQPKHLEELHNNLNNRTVICTLLDRCEDSFLLLPTLRFVNDDMCDDCKGIIDAIRKLIQENATKSAIATYAKQALCFRLPILKDTCKATIDEYIGLIMDMAASELDSGPTCAAMNLCAEGVAVDEQPKQVYSWINRPSAKGYAFFHSRLSRKEPEIKAIKDDSVCQDCMNVFSRIRDETKDPEFDKMLKDEIKNRICASFPSFLKSVCVSAISSEIDKLISEAGSTNITDLCVFFKQCEGPSSKPFAAKLRDLTNKVETSMRSNPVDDRNGLPFVCKFCEVFVEKVLEMTVNNFTEEAVEWALHNTCRLLPSKERQECDAIIDKYGDQIIKAIMSGAAPQIVCMGLGICGPMKGQVMPVFNLMDNSMVGGETSCKLCRMITDLLVSKMQTPAAKEEILKDVKAFCSYIPYYEAKCVSIVERYGELAYDLLVSNFSSEYLCEEIDLCPMPNSVAASDNAVEGGGGGGVGDTCTICVEIVQQIASHLSDNRTVEEIEHALDMICSIVPTSYATKCHEFVKERTPQLVELFMKHVKPRDICAEFGICYTPDLGVIAPEPKAPKKAPTCEICKYVVEYLFSQLKNDTTEEEITEQLRNACQYIPWKSVETECEEYVNAYTKILIDMFIKGHNPESVCQEMGLCPSKLLQAKLCAGGPTAWCRSAETAALCDKVEFCRVFSPHGGEQQQRQHQQPPLIARSPAVVRYDCARLVSRADRCANERIMRLCNFGDFCAATATDSSEEGGDGCRLCRTLVVRRLIGGAFALNCALYENPVEKAKCEEIQGMEISGRKRTSEIDAFCKEKNLCGGDSGVKSEQKEKTNLLGADPCLWGPSVVCRNAATAAACQLTDYCRTRVWSSSANPPLPATSVSPGLRLVDCARPLAELCVSPDVRQCGRGVLELCAKRGAEDSALRSQLCKDRSASQCSDPQMVALCDLEDYCEAMNLLSPPQSQAEKDVDVELTPPPQKETNKLGTGRPAECRTMGLSFACQSVANAIRCGMHEKCVQLAWRK